MSPSCCAKNPTSNARQLRMLEATLVRRRPLLIPCDPDSNPHHEAEESSRGHGPVRFSIAQEPNRDRDECEGGSYEPKDRCEPFSRCFIGHSLPGTRSRPHLRRQIQRRRCSWPSAPIACQAASRRSLKLISRDRVMFMRDRPLAANLTQANGQAELECDSFSVLTVVRASAVLKIPASLIAIHITQSSQPGNSRTRGGPRQQRAVAGRKVVSQALLARYVEGSEAA